MTIAIKPTASGSTIEQDGSTILTVDGSGNITPSNQMYPKVPAFRYWQSTQQTGISVSTSTKVNFQTASYDTTGGMFSNSRFTPTIAGYYQVNLGFKIESVTNRGILALYKNGGLYKLGDDVQATYVRNLTGSFLVYCNGSTDYIEAYGYHGGGGASNVSSSISHQTHFQAHLVSV